MVISNLGIVAPGPYKDKLRLAGRLLMSVFLLMLNSNVTMVYGRVEVKVNNDCDY